MNPALLQLFANRLNATVPAAPAGGGQVVDLDAYDQEQAARARAAPGYIELDDPTTAPLPPGVRPDLSSAGAAFARPEDPSAPTPTPVGAPPGFVGQRDLGRDQPPDPQGEAFAASAYRQLGEQQAEAARKAAVEGPGAPNLGLDPSGPRFYRQKDPGFGEYYRAVDASQGRQSEQAGKLNEAQVEAANIIGQGAALQGAIEMEHANESARMESDWHDRVQQKTNYAKQKSEEASSLKVDPGRLFRHQDTGQKIAMVIGGALGGFLAALNGGPNQFIEQMNKLVDMDIDAQRTDIEQARYGANRATDDLNETRSNLGDLRAGLLVKRDQQLAYGEAMVKRAMANTKSEELKARGQLMLEQFAQARAATQLDGKIAVARATALVPVGGGGSQNKTNRELTVRHPDGRAFEAPTKESADKLRMNLGYTQQLQDAVNRALAIRKGASAADLANPYSQASKDLDALQAEAAQILTVRRGQGAMSEGDQAVANRAIGAMKGLGSNNDAVLKNSSERWGKQWDIELKASGAEQIRAGYAVDPKTGKTATTREYEGSAARPTPAAPKGFKPAGGY